MFIELKNIKIMKHNKDPHLQVYIKLHSTINKPLCIYLSLIVLIYNIHIIFRRLKIVLPNT